MNYNEDDDDAYYASSDNLRDSLEETNIGELSSMICYDSDQYADYHWEELLDQPEDHHSQINCIN